MKFHTHNGEIHKGSKVDCPICKRLKKRKLKKGKPLCDCGKVLAPNNKSGMCWKCYQSYLKTHPELLPPPGKGGAYYKGAAKKRLCSTPGCGKRISTKNQSGLCITCFNKARAKASKEKKDALGRCSKCGKILCRQNQSGYCSRCFKNSEQWEEQRKEHLSWIAVNVCGVDVKDVSATDAPGG